MAEIQVQVCYAKPEAQVLRTVSVAEGADLRTAIESSGVLALMPEIDLSVCRVGIYGKLKTLDTALRHHDRVEIYRPLIADPKDSRRRRAIKKDGKNAR